MIKEGWSYMINARYRVGHEMQGCNPDLHASGESSCAKADFRGPHDDI